MINNKENKNFDMDTVYYISDEDEIYDMSNFMEGEYIKEEDPVVWYLENHMSRVTLGSIHEDMNDIKEGYLEDGDEYDYYSGCVKRTYSDYYGLESCLDSDTTYTDLENIRDRIEAKETIKIEKFDEVYLKFLIKSTEEEENNNKILDCSFM